MPKVSSSWAAVQIAPFSTAGASISPIPSQALTALPSLNWKRGDSATVIGITSFSRSTSQRIECVASFSSNCGLASASSSSWRLASTIDGAAHVAEAPGELLLLDALLDLGAGPGLLQRALQVAAGGLALDEDAAQVALARLQLLPSRPCPHRAPTAPVAMKTGAPMANAAAADSHIMQVAARMQSPQDPRPLPSIAGRTRVPHAPGWPAPPSRQCWQVNVALPAVAVFVHSSGSFRPRPRQTRHPGRSGASGTRAALRTGTSGGSTRLARSRIARPAKAGARLPG